MRRCLIEEIKEANMKNLSYEEFLCKLLLKEYDLRLESSKKNRIRLANFPYRKYLLKVKQNSRVKARLFSIVKKQKNIRIYPLPS